MTTTVVALGAATAALLLVLVLALVRMRRLRRAADERVAAAVGDLSARMESMVAELQGALERANEQARRNRALTELSGSLDLDDVLARVLEAAAGAAAADAAMVTLREPGGAPLAATLGLSADEAERQTAAAPPGDDVRSIGISYRYLEGEAPAPGRIHAGVAIPVPSEEGRIGMLTVFTRSPSGRFPEQTLPELEELARRAGPALVNARRFREARRLAGRDALTGLLNRRSFDETLAREVARAHRYDRRLALAVFGPLPGDAALAATAERLRAVVRSADVACRVEADELAAIMPESTAADAEQLCERLRAAVASRPSGRAGAPAVPAEQVQPCAGIAELRAGDDPASLLARAEEARGAAREAAAAPAY
jgi:diguanylate cyclase (GGDEF)-like protein